MTYCFFCEKTVNKINDKRSIPICSTCLSDSKRKTYTILNFKKEHYAKVLKMIKKKTIIKPLKCSACQNTQNLKPIINDFDNLKSTPFFCDECQTKRFNSYLHTIIGFDSIKNYEEFKKINYMNIIYFNIAVEGSGGVMVLGFLERRDYNKYTKVGSKK